MNSQFLAISHHIRSDKVNSVAGNDHDQFSDF